MRSHTIEPIAGALNLMEPVLAPPPTYSSATVANHLETSRRKIALFLHLQDYERVAAELRRMENAMAYLRANFPATAIARGPRPR